jgi:hypothetical protein
MHLALVAGDEYTAACQDAWNSSGGKVGLPPFTHNTGHLSEPPRRIYASDGGCHKLTSSDGDGSTAAAFVCRYFDPDGCVRDTAACVDEVVYGAWTELSTANSGEYAALLGAMIHADGQPAAFMMDTLLIYQQLFGTYKCEKPHLRKMYLACSDVHERNKHHWTFFRMFDSHAGFGNPADTHCTTIVNNRAGCGADDVNSFFPCGIPSRAGARGPVRGSNAIVPVAVTIKTVDILDLTQYCELKRFKVRSRVPTQVVKEWSVLVRQAYANMERADNPEELRKAWMQMLSLPSCYLPQSASTRHVISRIQTAQPFELRYTDEERAARTSDQRLASAVKRYAQDRDIKKAVTVVKNQSQNDDMSFDDKVKLLDSKQLRRSVPESLGAAQMAAIPEVPADIAPLPIDTVRLVLKKLKKNAANGIDGWNKTILMQAIEVDATILQCLSTCLRSIISRQLPTVVLKMILACRLVAVPKDGGGFRPICVAHLFAKLCGGIALKIDAPGIDEYQYGAGMPGGCEKAFHRIKRAYSNGKFIARLDCVNAFNAASRDWLHYILRKSHDTLRAYVRTFYNDASDLIVFGPNNSFEVLFSAEGIRQGLTDATHLFAYAIQECLAPVIEKWKLIIPGLEFFLYIDDATIACDDEKDLEPMLNDVVTALSRAKLLINKEKSAILCPLDKMPTKTSFADIKVVRPDDYFRVLGGNVCDNYGNYVATAIDKVTKFFDLLTRMHDILHPQVIFAMLRICGAGKLVFLCSTTPSAVSVPICREFERRVHQLVIKLTGSDSIALSPLSKRLIHHRAGLCLPDYVKHAAALLENSKKFSFSQAAKPRRNKLELIDITRLSPEIDAQLGALANAWMFFGGGTIELNPTEFRIAMAVRVRSNPLNTPLPMACACGAGIDSRAGRDDDPASEYIEHVLKCDLATKYMCSHRHDGVKWALANCARRYGIQVLDEPNFYDYDNGLNNRPDLTFFTCPPVATDITIVSPWDELGAHAVAARVEKIKKHKDAVAKHGHQFFPFAMEVYGHFDKQATWLINYLAKQLPDHLQSSFKEDTYHDISSALMRGVALAFMTTHFAQVKVANGVRA